jgi:hypothetical protein
LFACAEWDIRGTQSSSLGTSSTDHLGSGEDDARRAAIIKILYCVS